MNKTRIKTYTSLILFISIAFSIGAFGLSNSGYAESLTGSFTQAEKTDVHIENVRWEFDNGRIVEGRIAEQNFSEGVHNVTVYVEKSNGETGVHRAQIEVK